ncbi:MAG: hypothetical protein LBU65_04645 [Planctomycetaceae bacterium]|jgi:hypothetical protein|nr:hypothetical protein [Planctomycetaceae bacterium]
MPDFNIYLELDIFLDPAITDSEKLKTVLRDKVRKWNHNPEQYGLQISIANGFISGSVKYDLRQQAKQARWKRLNEGKRKAAVYEENGLLEQCEADAQIKEFERYFTKQTIMSWFTLPVAKQYDFVIPKRLEYNGIKVVPSGEMKGLARDLKIVLGNDDATLYDLIDVKMSASASEVDAKRLTLYNEIRLHPNRGKDITVDARIRLLGKTYFKDDASKRGYDIALSHRPFYKLVDEKFKQRRLKGFLTVPEYERSIEEVCGTGLSRVTATWLVYDYYYNVSGIKEPPQIVGCGQAAQPQNNSPAHTTASSRYNRFTTAYIPGSFRLLTQRILLFFVISFIPAFLCCLDGIYIAGLDFISTVALLNVLILVAPIGIVPFFISGIMSCILIHRAWAILQGSVKARTTPCNAVGLLFVPFFNIYWIFVCIVGLASDMNDYRNRFGLTHVKPVNRGLAIAICVVALIPYVQILLFFLLIPFFFSLSRVADAIQQHRLNAGTIEITQESIKRPRRLWNLPTISFTTVMVITVLAICLGINCAFSNDLLFEASYRRNARLVEMALYFGADVNAKDKDDNTPLDVAKTGEIRQILRDAGGE